MNNDIGALLQRVDRLERENLTAVRQVKLMKLAGLAVVLGIAVILFCGAKTPNNKVIEAQEFRVVDENGKTRANLAIINGEPKLSFQDKNGNLRAKLGLLAENPILALYDENENSHVFLSVVNGEPRLTLEDKNGNSLPVR
jgi:hypothetical protein